MPYAIPSSVDDTFGGDTFAPPPAAAAPANNSNNSHNMNMAAFDPSDVDKLLAGHLQELSVQDREGIAEEVSATKYFSLQTNPQDIRRSVLFCFVLSCPRMHFVVILWLRILF